MDRAVQSGIEGQEQVFGLGIECARIAPGTGMRSSGIEVHQLRKEHVCSGAFMDGGNCSLFYPAI